VPRFRESGSAPTGGEFGQGALADREDLTGVAPAKGFSEKSGRRSKRKSRFSFTLDLLEDTRVGTIWQEKLNLVTSPHLNLRRKYTSASPEFYKGDIRLPRLGDLGRRVGFEEEEQGHPPLRG